MELVGGEKCVFSILNEPRTLQHGSKTWEGVLDLGLGPGERANYGSCSYDDDRGVYFEDLPSHVLSLSLAVIRKRSMNPLHK